MTIAHPPYTPPQALQLVRPAATDSNAPLCILLPGLDGMGWLLHRQAEALSVSFDVRYLAIPATDCRDWDTLAEDVLGLIDQVHQSTPHRPVYLCGESFGACLAIALIRRSPHQFQALVLVNSATAFRETTWLNLGSHLAHWVPSALHPLSCVGLLPFLASLDRIGAGDRAALLQAMRSVSPAASHHRLGLLRQFMVHPTELEQMTQPTLLIASRGDRLLPSVQEAHHLARHLPNSTVHVLPHSGHACLLEKGVNLHHIIQSHPVLTKATLSDRKNKTGVLSYTPAEG
jgi:pimeloyl-ACP methyl ester carboxylesterase